MSKKHEIRNQSVAAVFESYPQRLKTKLLSLRELILDTADELDTVGEVEETLKWGQPSYLTKSPQSGTTVRIDAVKNNPQQYAMYVHCQTDLIARFRQMYPNDFNFLGKRGLTFNVDDDLPEKQLSHCIALALTYHLIK